MSRAVERRRSNAASDVLAPIESGAVAAGMVAQADRLRPAGSVDVALRDAIWRAELDDRMRRVQAWRSNDRRSCRAVPPP